VNSAVKTGSTRPMNIRPTQHLFIKNVITATCFGPC